MAEAKDSLLKLEGALKRYDSIVEIFIYLTTMDERGSTLYETLVGVEEQVKSLNDSRLNSLYERLVEGHRTFLPKFEQILGTDYKTFVARALKLSQEAAVEMNEADIALKEALGLDATTGIWGPRGWRPPQT